MHNSEVRGGVARSSHGTNANCNEDKWIIKGMNLESNEHLHRTDNSLSVSVFLVFNFFLFFARQARFRQLGLHHENMPI